MSPGPGAASLSNRPKSIKEKPCCVDAGGYRSLLETNKLADEKHLKVGVGLFRRHLPKYLDAMSRIRDGAIGKIQFMRCYCNMTAWGGGSPHKEGVSELEHQIRNWRVFDWLGGGHWHDTLETAAILRRLLVRKPPPAKGGDPPAEHPQFYKMLGGYVQRHPPFAPIRVRVTAPDHAITQGMEDFVIEDELFLFRNLEPDNEVLLEAEFEGRESASQSPREVRIARNRAKGRRCWWKP
jgi:hypothetical protein